MVVQRRVAHSCPAGSPCPKHWCARCASTPRFIVDEWSQNGVNVRSASCPRTLYGASQSLVSYSQASSSLTLCTRPSTTSAFSVEPVPSVHRAPTCTPMTCPSTTPEPAPQFHRTEYGHRPRPWSSTAQDSPAATTCSVPSTQSLP